MLGCVLFVDVALNGHGRTVDLLTWIDTGDLQVEWALRYDALSAVMVAMVTVVSCMVHVYSVGYMAHDKSIPRFMAYLSLFTFFMLMLVTADNFLQLFFGWEGVGLCSYLLIGFWYDRPSANAAAIKAFIVNRIGDFGFALGIFTVYLIFGSLQFDTVFAAAPDVARNTINFLGFDLDAITVACILLFIGAMGKSAQLGLHTWLPDAMEGPTPVSALIHAATMVTAGVFMLARLSPLFEYSPVALGVVVVVGGSTAIFAASVGIAQNDIKRVIADRGREEHGAAADHDDADATGEYSNSGDSRASEHAAVTIVAALMPPATAFHRVGQPGVERDLRRFAPWRR